MANLNYNIDKTDLILQQEANKYEKYLDKIDEILFARETIIQNNEASLVSGIEEQGVLLNGGIVDRRSILKQPTAALPIFCSVPQLSFELYVQNFVETTIKYNYAELNKFLLLK